MTNLLHSTHSSSFFTKYSQPVLWVAALILIGVGFFLFNLSTSLPLDLVWQATVKPDENDFRQVIYFYSFLPKITIALLVGAGLALSGCVMQQVLNNTLASPTTLGVAAGAELGLACALLLVPTGLAIDPDWFAFIGGLLATGMVFLISASKGFAPLQMVLAGMVISLLFGAINRVLVLLNDQQLDSLFIWGAGDLSQTDWQNVAHLLPQIAIPFMLLLLLQRPLTLLQVGEQLASSAGVKVGAIRLISLTLAVFITTSVVSTVGIIGFVGLVAPALAKLAGARQFYARLIVSAIIGALLMLMADLVVHPFSGVGGELLPTGAITALIGAPFLIWLLLQNPLAVVAKATSEQPVNIRQYAFVKLLIVCFIVAIICTTTALLVGKNEHGWSVQLVDSMLALRLPRVFAAFLAGWGLAVAGCVIQRITVNPMASPEVMGVSSGVALMLVVGVISGMISSRGEQLLFGGMGALLAFGIMWLFSQRSRFAPTQMVLVGVALSAFLDATIRILLTSGTDQAKTVLTWLSGSTYLVTNMDVALLLIITTILLVVLLLLHRCLDLLTLGEAAATGLGMNCQQGRLWLLIIAAILTTVATLVVGPLSFVGLLAPQLAKLCGQHAARNQLITAGFMGSTIMVVADWLGRNWLFPWQIPAGILASIIGGGFFLLFLRK
ncbi:Fe(3+)-hydroxamate ABC transporter permease FhuB [Endozoicomonas sp. SM1973]|uniref:Fe(3+)-hydroxamate ABC transporter permease FhuB n=1 Tax=Spartinivicinus marinus TaxID=2994442 RepID=A0A853HWQ3_9GAMM|nr:Fe(3+)-hydroxamate ABC transporter permease FhuB [Spartinivicinus marinus]MCX4028348.1 Fe(3+)-hydroxamate ABC transporter permease FhuB [Spartinivicinus marinus]NYZ65683.1 Fe(3+)-hydroxamate ABC transporter permease FhuB [Spartinivicinus marinus]